MSELPARAGDERPISGPLGGISSSPDPVGNGLPTKAGDRVPTKAGDGLPAKTGDELPVDASSERSAGAGPTGLARRPGGELTTAELASRRRNRRWMGLVLAPSLVIGGVALIAAFIASSSQPSQRPADVPSGYKAVNDGYFAYAVPSSWSTDSAYTDDVGDLDTEGATGWAAEHVGARPNPPAPGEAPPSSFAAFGEPQPTNFTIGSATSIQVAGATVAYRYTITRPKGFSATAIDAWQSNSGAEIWLLVYTNPATTATVLGSLKG